MLNKPFYHHDTLGYLNNYFSKESAEALLEHSKTLMILPYGNLCEPTSPGIINTGLTALPPHKQLINEVWTVSDKVTRGITGKCHWNKTESLISASIWLTKEECFDIENKTEVAYTELLKFIRSEGYPNPFRFWNYIPNINLGDNDKEQYKLFCNGRLNAFRRSGLTVDEYPSASALGHHADGAVYYVLSAKKPGTHYRNSLQTNAFQYPREYGASSPSFSRATELTLNGQNLFLISGTASIVGHQTIAEGDIVGQIKTTIKNITHLLKTERQHNREIRIISAKVYLRFADDLEQTHKLLNDLLPTKEIIYIHADICRSDLMIEIECFCG
jgi:chorismate lyase/3-hydroxybenzoate synthase